jgi:DNA-binding transcriptional LysR family regulator
MDWRDRFAPEVEDLNRAAVVTNHGLAIHQALQGQGVTLGWTGIIADLLDGGALVRLHHSELCSDRGYWLVARFGFFETPGGAARRTALTEPGGPVADVQGRCRCAARWDVA